ACRERAAIFDETSFSKIDVTGPGAEAFLRRVCAGRVGGLPGTVAYTQMLNERGGIECDVTVTAVGDEHYRVVTGTAFGRHDLSWLRSHAPEAGSVQVTDATRATACIGLWGPVSRDILQPLTQDELSNDAFPYMTARPIAVGPVPCLAVRVTYVGELGWELYCPMEFGLRLWDELWEGGSALGLVAGG